MLIIHSHKPEYPALSPWGWLYCAVGMCHHGRDLRGLAPMSQAAGYWGMNTLVVMVST